MKHIKTLFILGAAFILSCCTRDSAPETIDPDSLRVLSVSQLKDLAPDGELEYKVTLSATVMSKKDNMESNFFMIQDGNGSKDGLRVDFSSAHNFECGALVNIYLEGCSMETSNNGMRTLIISNPASANTQESATPFSAVSITPAQFATGNFQSMYVSMEGFEVIDENLEKKMAGSLLFQNKAKDTITVSTLSSASFAQSEVPSLSGTIKGVVSLLDGIYVLMPQSMDDLNLTNKRFKVDAKNNAAILWATGVDLNGYLQDVSTNEPEESNIISLDDNGSNPANCFVVNKKGTYSFAAKNPLGNYPAGIPEGTEIYFNVTKLGGNTVVAYIDDKGVVLWSWHIWLPNASIEEMSYPISNSTGSITIFDRVLGATSSSAVGSPEVSGFGYQWGRKDPFPGPSGIGQVASADAEKTITMGEDFGTAYTAICTVNTNVVPIFYQDGGDDQTMSHETIAAFPTRFIYDDSYANYPVSSEVMEWETISNPCPYGWKVMSIADNKVFTDGSTSFSSLVKASDKSTFGMDKNKMGCYLKDYPFWFQNTGYRAIKNARLLDVGRAYQQWTSQNVSSTNAYQFRINQSAIALDNSTKKGNGIAVRCVKIK